MKTKETHYNDEQLSALIDMRAYDIVIITLNKILRNNPDLDKQAKYQIFQAKIQADEKFKEAQKRFRDIGGLDVCSNQMDLKNKT